MLRFNPFAALWRCFVDVAGFPPRTVWFWGTRLSLLALLLSITFFVLRLVSPLQWVKYCYRRLPTPAPNLSRSQLRPDFHALYTEFYFLAVIVFTFIIYYNDSFKCHFPDVARVIALVTEIHAPWPSMSGPCWLSFIIVLIFTIESFTWVSYYLFWRNFAEPVYTLYHPAEYFVLFPVVLAVQILALAILMEHSARDIILMMVGGFSEPPLPLRLLGFFYFAVLLANLLRMYPQTRFKSATAVNIVGAGDVVANRLAPALVRSEGELSACHLRVYTIERSNSLLEPLQKLGIPVEVYDKFPRKDDNKNEIEILKKLVAAGIPTIIATPSDSHFVYFSALNAAGLRYAVEKPLSIFDQEIDLLRNNASIYRNNLFALSYYGLEKALPVSYLLSPNHHFEKYLEIEGDALIDSEGADLRAVTPRLIKRLGTLESLRVDLIEGPERSPTATKRAWTERRGGLAYETLIHPLLLAQKFAVFTGDKLCGFQPTVIRGRSRDAAVRDAVTFLRLDGSIGQANVVLAAGKYGDNKSVRRVGTAEFTAGEIKFDFDKMEAVICLKDGKQATVRVKNSYQGKYLVQADLVMNFFAKGWTDIRFDDFEDQIEVLSWLQRRNLEEGEGFVYGKDSKIGFGELHSSLE